MNAWYLPGFVKNLVKWAVENSWTVNAWAIGLPYLIFVVAAIGYNLYANIKWNQYWARGNWFLIGSTYYLMIQGFFSSLLMFEFTYILDEKRRIRALSFLSALVYDSFFIITDADWCFQIFWSDNSNLAKSDSSLFDMGWALFVAYNAIQNFPVAIIDLCIILKEAQL